MNGCDHWIPLDGGDTPPQNGDWFMALTAKDEVRRVHYTSNHTGDDQPAYEGYFVQLSPGYFNQVANIIAWKPEHGTCSRCGQEV